MAEATRQRWLILVHQLPPRPSNLRVRVWRRLQQVGAVVLRNSLYVLPSTDESREDFNWVREEIATAGGEVSIFEASTIDGYTDAELVQQFRADRAAEYHALAAEIREARGTKRPALDRDLQRLRERLAVITARDYFEVPERSEAQEALAEIEASDARNVVPPAARLRSMDFKGRVWVTRPHPGIDRMASAWLIKRFIAPDAKFAFTPVHAARLNGRIPFDMPDAEFGHHGPHCTFETLVRRFGINDRAVTAVGRVVHDLDLKEERYGMPERIAVGRIVAGLRTAVADDGELLAQGMTMIDALYLSFSADGTAARGKRNVRKRRR